MTFFQDTRFNPQRSHTMGEVVDELHMKRNFELCRAINLTSLHCVVKSMVNSGDLDANVAELYLAQAGSLLALLRTENNRGLGF